MPGLWRGVAVSSVLELLGAALDDGTWFAMSSNEILQLPIEELPDLPECRVSAGVDVGGAIRFEIEEWYARKLRDQLEIGLENHSKDELLEIIFPLSYPAYASLTKGFADLWRSSSVNIKQVSVHPEPDIAVTVIANDSQIETSAKKNYRAIKENGHERIYTQQFSINPNGAVILHQQLEAALDEHESPLDAIDLEDDRFDELEGSR